MVTTTKKTVTMTGSRMDGNRQNHPTMRPRQTKKEHGHHRPSTMTTIDRHDHRPVTGDRAHGGVVTYDRSMVTGHRSQYLHS